MTTRVCIADDQESARALLRRILSEFPEVLIVGEARDGSATVALCREANPDIVLLDISMPGMNGVEAARILASLPVPPKIVTLSMHDDAFLAAEILNAGANAYLTKDCDPGEIIRAIRTVMNGRTYLSAGIAGPVIDSFIRRNSDPRKKQPGKPEGSLSRLSPRERQVFRHMTLGLSPREISEHLGISHKTVETHRSNLLKKLGLHKMTDLIRLAIREGLIDP
jgi:DNA-binding NarL/FixJ family response regulator